MARCTGTIRLGSDIVLQCDRKVGHLAMHCHNNTSVDHKEYLLAWRDPGVPPSDICCPVNQMHDKPRDPRGEFVPGRIWRRKKRA